MLKSLLFSAAVLCTSLGTANAAVIFADNFNSDPKGLGLTSLTNWTATSGDVDVIGPGFFDFYPGNGNYVDMNGNDNATLRSSLLNFVVGKVYTLTFDFGYNKGSGPTNEQLDVGVGSTTLASLGAALLATANPGFKSYSVSFKATSATASLFFADPKPSPNDNGGPVIDNVVVSTVPLPAAAPMLLAGLAGLGALARRRRRA